MTQYRKRYLVESSRLKGWDYSANGRYYITLVTKNRDPIFGEIRNKEMQLSEIGQIVLTEWEKSFQIRLELTCKCYVIMPNHIHAVVILDNPQQYSVDLDYGHGDAQPCVFRTEELPYFDPDCISNQTGLFRPPKSISSFVAGFKSAATTRINQYRRTPYKKVWQPRFYDHLVRDKEEYLRIRKYILENPANCMKDSLL